MKATKRELQTLKNAIMKKTVADFYIDEDSGITGRFENNIVKGIYGIICINHNATWFSLYIHHNGNKYLFFHDNHDKLIEDIHEHTF